jgi:peptidoglycan-associated lipoprotein
MKQIKWTYLALIFVVSVVFLVPSCAKKEISSEPYMSEEEARRRAAEEAKQRELEKQAAIGEESLKEERLKEEMERERAQVERDMFVNEDIQFEFDSYSLSAEAQNILRKKADWLKENPRVTVIIEGHCDERGTTEYNLALGDRRAFSAKSYLQDIGIAESRMSTVSYGEERPLERGSSEEAWAKNRRAHFVIKE